METFLVFLEGNTTKSIAENLDGGRAGKRRAHPLVFRENLLKKHSLPLTAGGLGGWVAGGLDGWVGGWLVGWWQRIGFDFLGPGFPGG